MWNSSYTVRFFYTKHWKWMIEAIVFCNILVGPVNKLRPQHFRRLNRLLWAVRRALLWLVLGTALAWNSLGGAEERSGWLNALSWLDNSSGYLEYVIAVVWMPLNHQRGRANHVVTSWPISTLDFDQVTIVWEGLVQLIGLTSLMLGLKAACGIKP